MHLCRSIHILKSEKGFGIIAAMIAAAIVVLIALVVSKIIVDQNKISARISSANSCSDISQTVVNYLKQDGDSLDIHSMPIESDGTFPAYANAVVNADGNLRYVFQSGIGTPAMVSSDALQVASTGQVNLPTVVTNTFRIHNYLNINNSLSRLVSIGTQANFCNWGTVYDSASGVNFLDGIEVSGVNLRIEMRVDFLEGGQSMCALGSLTRLPSSHKGLLARFDLRVTVNPQGTEPKSCDASSSITLSSDSTPPAVVMHISSIDPANRCDTVSGTPNSYCVMGARRQTNNIQAEVVTVQNTAGCQSCLRSGDPIDGTPPNIGLDPDNKYRTCDPSLSNINLITGCVGSAASSSCRESDPGSIFYCKLTHREQTTNLNTWWPCHAKPNTIPGVATITYTDISGDLDETQTTTRANINITGLSSGRDWILDVRAVDTFGQTLGRSFLDIADDGAIVPVPSPMPAPPVDGRFRDCSCNGTCEWTPGAILVPCPGAPTAGVPAPTCTAGNPVGTLQFVAAWEQRDVYCSYPSVPGTPIWEENCDLTSKPAGFTTQCRLPCVAAAGANHQCLNWGAWGACAAGTQTRSGQCHDVTPNPDVLVANANCNGAGQNNCVQTQACGAPPPTCGSWDPWTDCTPDCLNQNCEETRTGTCFDNLGNVVADALCGGCLESRTDTATGCAFSCDTSGATPSTCSAGPCNQQGEITFSGAVCRDSSNTIVDVANCGGDCNPPPQSCDRGCTTSCVETGAWNPDPCTTPCGAAVPTQQSRPTTCQYSDGTACADACTDVVRGCPAEVCAACGGTPHGGTQTVTTYPSATGTCASPCSGGDETLTCNNGVLSSPTNPFSSCVNPSGCLSCRGQYDEYGLSDTGYTCMGMGGSCGCNSIPFGDPCTITVNQPDGTTLTCNGAMNGRWEGTGACGAGGSMYDCDCRYVPYCSVP